MKKRAFSLFVCLCLVLSLLSACGAVKRLSQRVQNRREETEETDDTMPEQQELDQELTQEICQRTEMQMIAAAVSHESYLAGSSDNTPAYYGNVDADPEPELLYGNSILYFDFTREGRYTNIHYAPSGFSYYLDKDGNFYESYGGGDISIPKPDGGYIDQEDGFVVYNRDRSASFAQANNYGSTCLYYVNGQEVTAQEYNKQWNDMGMTELTDQSVPFTAYSYDAAYSDALAELLDDYFAEEFASYHGMFTGDIDEDGIDETLFIIENYMEPWFTDIMSKEDPMFKGLVAQTISLVRNRTGFVLLDPGSEDVQIRTHCVEGGVAVVEDAPLTVRDNVILVGDAITHMPADSTDITYFKSQLESKAAANNWQNLSIQEISLTGNDQTDLLCTYRQGDQVYAAVIMIRDGYIRQVHTEPLGDDTFMVTQYDGKPAILCYRHNASQYNGATHEEYFYCFLVIDRNGEVHVMEGQELTSSYGSITESALKTFMDKLKPYLSGVQVIYDPFAISGTLVIPQGVTPPTVTEPEPSQPEQEMTALEYWVENCHVIHFTEADLQGFTAEDCRIARNAVYAHSGRKFQDATLNAYFEGFDWYVGTVDPNGFDQNMLNDAQNDNLNLVIEYEKTMGYR